MIPTTPNDRLSENTIRHQHQQLKSLMEAIASRFHYEKNPTQSLVSLLKALAIHLQMHFEFEETDGYFPRLAQKTPHVSATVERLLREHKWMLEEIDDMVAMAREVFASALDTSDLAKRFSQFHTRLVNHEHEENKLIQDVYNIDIGTHD